MKTACITGITGQAGSYLCELLLYKGYVVYGLKRRSSLLNTDRIDHLITNENLKLVYGDLSDYSSLLNFVGDIKPDLFFNLAAQSHVRVSFDIPEYTMDITGTSVIRLLEAIRKFSPKTKFLTASSSEMFGSSPPPQNEVTQFHPRSPYAIAKIAGYYSVVNYREAYNMFASNAISFNYESPRRGETFVTRKITRAATRIKLGLQKELLLGNLEARRDWSHAKDVVNAMYHIINQPESSDYVIASGEMHSIKEFLDIVFSKLDLDWKEYVKIDPKYFRPSEVDALCGDSTKLKNIGWSPEYSFTDLVNEMILSDLDLAKKEHMIKYGK
jgi:GDPmannose 4,6-dehydratase